MNLKQLKYNIKFETWQGIFWNRLCENLPFEGVSETGLAKSVCQFKKPILDFLKKKRTLISLIQIQITPKELTLYEHREKAVRYYFIPCHRKTNTINYIK